MSFQVSLVVIYIFTTRGQNLHVIRSNHVVSKQLEGRWKEENRGSRNESRPKKGRLIFLKKCIKDIYTEINRELHISSRSWHKPRMCFFVFLNYPVIRLHQYTHRHTYTHTCSQSAKGRDVQGQSARHRQKVNSSDHFNESATINRHRLTFVTFYRGHLGDLLTFRARINNEAGVWIQIILMYMDKYVRVRLLDQSTSLTFSRNKEILQYIYFNMKNSLARMSHD